MAIAASIMVVVGLVICVRLVNTLTDRGIQADRNHTGGYTTNGEIAAGAAGLALIAGGVVTFAISRRASSEK
jgi:hypothetical protein